MLCFRKLLVAKKFVDKKEGGVTKLSVENFCLKVPKIFVGEPSSLSFFSGFEKVWMRGWGGGSVKIFRLKFLVSQCRNFS